MNLKMSINKKGSYLVEAVISLPLFIIAVMVMSSVILMYACIEDCNFIAAQELRRGAAEAAIADTSVAVPVRIRKEIEGRHSRVESMRLTDAAFRDERWGADELIAVTYRMRLASPNPIGINARAEYSLSLVTRAYVGRIRNVGSMSAEEFAGSGSEAVYIFPKYGKRYHSEGCGFLHAASRSGALTEEIRRKYKSCPLCHSSKASSGALIYYFPSAGEDYHLPGCGSLQRNFIEIEKSVAVERGYTPCAKCGG